MTSSAPGDAAGFGWESPRWRDATPVAQHDTEHDRRFRNTPAPCQRGAIDDHRSLAPGERWSEGRRREASRTQDSLLPMAPTREIDGDR